MMETVVGDGVMEVVRGTRPLRTGWDEGSERTVMGDRLMTATKKWMTIAETRTRTTITNTRMVTTETRTTTTETRMVTAKMKTRTTTTEMRMVTAETRTRTTTTETMTRTTTTETRTRTTTTETRTRTTTTETRTRTTTTEMTTRTATTETRTRTTTAEMRTTMTTTTADMRTTAEETKTTATWESEVGDGVVEVVGGEGSGERVMGDLSRTATAATATDEDNNHLLQPSLATNASHQFSFSYTSYIRAFLAMEITELIRATHEPRLRATHKRQTFRTRNFCRFSQSVRYSG